jgi:RNA polymerase sigma-70 factor, ECF subfamily
MISSAQLLPSTVTFFCPTATIIPEMSSLDVPADNHPTDAVLVARCLAGDKAAFGLLISRCRPQLRRLLWTMLGDTFEVDDLLQESFLQAYLGLGQLRQPERFGAWVYGIALNLARMRLRSRPSSPASLEVLPGGVVIGDAISEQPPLPEAAVEQLEVAKRLRQAIAALPDAERQAVRRVLLEGLSHRETAAALGTTVGAVKDRLHRGRQRLRAALEADLAPTRPALSFKEITMIGVRIDDVMLKIREEEPGGEPIIATVLKDLPKCSHFFSFP